MNKPKIERKLKRYHIIDNIGTSMFAIGFGSIVLMDILILIIGINYFIQIIFVSAFILMVMAFLLGRGPENHIKRKITKEIAEMVIDQYVYDSVYDPKALQVKSTLDDLYLALPPYDDLNASDHIIGTYKGRSIEIADIRLREERQTGKNATAVVTVFQGLLIKIETFKSISSPLTISPRNFGESNIETENDTFNNKFDIYCEDEHDALYILTPQTIERILAFKKHMEGGIYLCFADDGYLYCAINEGRDRFELNMKQKTLDDISKGFDKDMQYVMSLIDELLNILEEQKESSVA